LPFSSKYSNFSDSPEELKKFLTYNKIAKLKNQDNNINRFCKFFESNIKKYKGMENENFVYYLKELEFKFNYQINERYNIVIKLMYASISR
jgi:transposase-like protein